MKEKLFKIWKYYLENPELVSEFWCSGLSRGNIAFRMFLKQGVPKSYNGLFLIMAEEYSSYKIGYEKYEIEITPQEFEQLKLAWTNRQDLIREKEKEQYQFEAEQSRREMELLADSIS